MLPNTVTNLIKIVMIVTYLKFSNALYTLYKICSVNLVNIIKAPINIQLISFSLISELSIKTSYL